MIFSALSANRQSYVKQGNDSNDKNMNGNCSLNQLVCIIIWLLEFTLGLVLTASKERHTK